MRLKPRLRASDPSLMALIELKLPHLSLSPCCCEKRRGFAASGPWRSALTSQKTLSASRTKPHGALVDPAGVFRGVAIAVVATKVDGFLLEG